MSTYALIYIGYFALVALYGASKIRLTAWLPLIYIVAIAALSSKVGTDTWIYNNYYSDIRQNGCGGGELEPLFCAYVNLLTSLFETDAAIRAFNAVFIGLLLFWPFRRTYRRQIIVLSVLMPIVYLDYAMNGVRSGIAYSIIYFVIAMGSRLEGVWKRRIMLLAAMSIHVSGVLVLMLQKIAGRGYKISTIVLSVLTLAIAGYFIGKLFQLELFLRFLTSLDSEPFSIFSGYLPAIVNIGMLYILRRHCHLSKKSFYALLAANLISLAAARFTYNGIRLLQIILFIEMIALTTKLHRRLGMQSKAILTLIVLVTLTAKLRNWDTEAEAALTETPFIPYHITLGSE